MKILQLKSNVDTNLVSVYPEGEDQIFDVWSEPKVLSEILKNRYVIFKQFMISYLVPAIL